MKGPVIEQRIVFSGTGRWKLACGPMLLETSNGDLLCAWLSGGDGEPARDNCVLITRSSDRGRTWEKETVFLPAGEMASALTSWFVAPGGRIIAFSASWPSEKSYTQWFYTRRESDDHGRTWSVPEPVCVHDKRACFVSPIRLRSGERLFPASIFDPRERPLTGPVSDLVLARTEDEAAAIPARSGAIPSGKFGTHRHGCCVLIAADPEARTLVEYGCIANRPLGLLEPTVVQLNDDRLVILMRAEWGGFLWQAESADDGRTWSDAWETDIPNPTTLATLIRLPSGRIALVHNATGKKSVFGVRNPLSIWVSDDELRTWSIRKDVIATSGNLRPATWPDGLDQLAYPNAIILDGRLVFAYDRNRRDILFVETNLR